ncbi:hypothetical protein [Flexivirga caeni]|uniref:Type II toxin-antitoxin system RelE/ParE family toxin n=1 Tax=Flexivirga caeni TaxID=2294115 RepID=A0A3M9M5Q1_9MICO|nr:hypothetical protein [Flexivirga caeni]RNI19858.1 hypothetical protein EFY87_15630 [Flexivirga caeni]
MIIDAPAEFWDWVDRLEVEAMNGSRRAGEKLDLVQALLEELEDLKRAPTKEDETATLKWVRQSRRNLLWRVAHPYREGVAVRLICWFPPRDDETVVVALFAGDKAPIGDVFYDSVGHRADPLIEQWKREVQRSRTNE